MAGLLFADAFEQLLEFFGAGFDVAAEAASGDFDGHDGRHAIGESDDGGGDAAGISEFGGAVEFHANGEGIEEPVRDQNAEERAHEGGGDVMADLLDGAGDGTHGDDDAEHGGDDAEAGHGIGGFGQDVDGLVMFLVHGL